MARPQRLKHLLLLALRILAIAGLSFMMARPILEPKGLFALGKEKANVLILDNSLSMGYGEENGERYEIAKRAAQEVIQALKDQVILIPTVALPERDVRWMSPEEALKELPKIPLSFGKGDPGASLRLGYQKLNEMKMPGEILFISDMAQGDWEGFHLSDLGTLSSDKGITFLRIGGAHRDPNFSVRGVKRVEGEAVVGVPVRLEVTLSNLSDNSGTPLVQLYASGVKKDQKAVELKAREEGKVTFELLFDRPGWADMEVRLSGDRLPQDDRFYFPLNVREKIKVLLIDGDPRTSIKASESYYLVNALQPGGSESSPFVTKVITEEEYSHADLKRYDVFFLLNVSGLKPSKHSLIFESGKAVFIFLGDRVLPEEYNSFILFPWKIGGMREAGSSKPERVEQTDESHETLKNIATQGRKSLQGASIHRYFRIDGSLRNLLLLGNRDPLLMEGELGKTKLFLYASSADLDWNDLPLKAAFLPLIQGLIKEVVGLHKNSMPEGIRFGEPFEEKVRPVQVAGDPGGPGIYKFSLPEGEVRRGVNPPFEESDLSKVDREGVRKKFEKTDVKLIEYREGIVRGAQAGKRELWPFLLGFVLVVLVVEMGVANGSPWKGKE
jgi:hypothetical protein